MSWLRAVILWGHVVSASWWVLACLTMALVGAVLDTDSAEGREFVLRVVPKFNRTNTVAAAVLLLTGLVNLFEVGRPRGFAFPPAFTRVLAAKVALYVMMFAALRASLSAGRDLRERSEKRGPATATVGIGRLAGLSAIAAIMGAGGMLLGVWLAGT